MDNTHTLPTVRWLLDNSDRENYLSEILENHGENREKTKFNQIGAANDLEAVQLYLKSLRDSKNTLATYRKEIERFLLWALLNKQKTLSSLQLDDFIAYEQFIECPDTDWICKHGTRRTDKQGDPNQNWRPFTGPLSANSQKIAIASINAMMNYLVAANYLSSNPLLLDKKHRQKLAKECETEKFHALSEQEWDWIWNALENLPQKTPGQQNHYERLRFILNMFYCTACRIGEFASHKMNSFQLNHNGKWYWHVVGKGQKKEVLPVNSELLNALVRYRLYIGLPAFPTVDENVPLLLSQKGTRGIKARRLSTIIENFFNHAADQVKDISLVSSENIRNATAHWIRHTALSHAAKRNNDIRIIKRFGRHNHIQTTTKYVHIEDQELESLIDSQLPKRQ
jgi:site-specific recombinase XerD